MAEEIWVARAAKELGVRETPGPGDTKAILDYGVAAKLPQKYWHDSIAWCAVFVSAMLELCGIRSARSTWSLDYRDYGTKLDRPKRGCIAVFNHGNGHGHVGFYLRHSEDGKYVEILGGNQSDAVTKQWFLASKVKHWRWPPAPTESTESNEPTQLELPIPRPAPTTPAPVREVEQPCGSEGNPCPKAAGKDLRAKGSRTLVAVDRIVAYVKAALAALGLTGLGEVVAAKDNVDKLAPGVSLALPMLVIGTILVVAILYETFRIEDARVDDYMAGKRLAGGDK